MKIILYIFGGLDLKNFQHHGPGFLYDCGTSRVIQIDHKMVLVNILQAPTYYMQTVKVPLEVFTTHVLLPRSAFVIEARDKI